MASRGVLTAACVVGGLTMTGVALTASRWRRTEARRAELNNEYADVLTELRSLNDARLKDAEDLRRKRKETALMHETVATIWADRLARYVQTNKELHSFLKALPEALGALKGLTNHYQYMATEMRKFVAFDVACSKVHNFALLLEHGEHVGMPRVVERIRQLLIAEPLVQVVCDSVSQVPADISCPSSLGECSSSFVFCMEELDRAIELAVARHLEFQSEEGKKTPNVICDGVRKLTNEARLNTLTKGDIALQKERRALRDLLLRDRRQLHTTGDLRSALEYVEGVSDRLCTDDAGEAGLRKIISTDAAVKAAQDQLLLWRRSAAVFLVQQQAKEVLEAYQLLLAETLTKTRSG
ncbi:uncharacterized protein Tco025E_06068 [Trypanosoma conorhini]|uniref:Uncharacterized protein n=1 Tax=Trypanosoma conorhini TaxID=83891 RepID=A0A422P7M0_9TRYP|nr:uncharacterized protein Tco025E_06068 [Trypanosoma conorhini]RNF13722.1 hypothetical protein Tco025E_06068 [Trypanosoma conorhini]